MSFAGNRGGYLRDKVFDGDLICGPDAIFSTVTYVGLKDVEGALGVAAIKCDRDRFVWLQGNLHCWGRDGTCPSPAQSLRPPCENGRGEVSSPGAERNRRRKYVVFSGLYTRGSAPLLR